MTKRNAIMTGCTRCDSLVPDEAKFCPRCGEPVEHKQAATLKEERPNICPQCGTDNPSVARFCKKDGFRLQKEQNDPLIPSSLTPDAPVFAVPQGASGIDDVSIAISPPEETSTQITEASERLIIAEPSLDQPSFNPDLPGVQQVGKKERMTPSAKDRKRSLFLPGVILVFVVMGVLWGWYAFVRVRPVVVPVYPQNKPAVTTQEKPTSTPAEQPPAPSSPDIAAPAPSSVPETKDDPQELERTINTELKAKGIGTVSIKITQDMTGIVRGQVKDENAKARALKIVAVHGDLISINDKIVVKPTEQPVEPTKLEEKLNRALKKAGVGSVTAEVSGTYRVTLKGIVQNNQERDKALSVARSFKDLKGVRDIIFVIAP